MQIINDLKLDLTIQDYTKAKNLFLNFCKSAKISQNNIGFFGEVGFPGISDIDALVISTPDKIKKLNLLVQQETANSASFNYLFWHPPVFVLDSIQKKANILHTLEGLKSIKSGANLFNHKTLNYEETDVLNIVWFLSLISVISDMQRTISNNDPISLRLCLLVYKNLIHSFNKFSLDEEDLPNNLLSSQELRTLVKEKYNSQLNEFLLNQFFMLFNLTCNRFDNFCQLQLALKSDTGKTSLISSQTKVYRKGDETVIKVKRFYNLIKINKFAFQLLLEYHIGKSTHHALNNYIIASKACKVEYKKFNIHYPFIQPFSLPISKYKRNLLVILNSIRVVDFL